MKFNFDPSITKKSMEKRETEIGFPPGHEFKIEFQIECFFAVFRAQRNKNQICVVFAFDFA